jgi:preprotein translocase subunit SecD
MKHWFSHLPVLWWVKFGLVVFVMLMSTLYAVPSFFGPSENWPRQPVAEGESPLQGKPIHLHHQILESFFPSSHINLGLDLKGGLHLVLEVEIQKSIQDSILRAVNRGRDNLAKENVQTKTPTIDNRFNVTLELENPAQKDQVAKAISEQSALILQDKFADNKLTFVGHSQNIRNYESQVLDQAVNTLRNRIDQFGVAEPNIFKQGNERIVIQMPGLQDPSRAKALIGNTARLDFRLVLNEVASEPLQQMVEEAQKALNLNVQDTSIESIQKVSQWLRDQKKISENATVMLQRNYETQGGVSKVVSSLAYLVQKNSKLTGELIDRADATQTQDSLVPQYAVSLKFNPQGAKIFGDLTTEARDSKNAPHQIAIVLDENISSAPVVNTPILNGDAIITMGRRGADQEAQLKEAQDLALVLRAGALPATVKIIEERQVGPSEGEENIKSGVLSSGLAAVIVVIFMLSFYGSSGMVANFAMALNVLIILAFMAAFGATLTLPGIAGIVLTMAVAVDGNVIINERIREEMRAGLSPKAAFYKGYSMSFGTLVDAHVTSAVAGFVLLVYGNPAVKGFAITLLVGIVGTLFTSYYVTEVLGQWLVEKTKIKRFA